MNKSLIAAVTAIVAVTGVLVPSAEAGFKGHLGVGLAIGALILSHQHHEYRHRQERHYVRHYSKKTYVAKKADDDEPKAAPVKDAAAETENSSITVAALPAPEATATQETVNSAETTASVALPPVVPAEPGAGRDRTIRCGQDGKWRRLQEILSFSRPHALGAVRLTP